MTPKAPVALFTTAAALLLAGCASPYTSPVEVTRFTGQAPARLGMGTLAVRAAPGMPAPSLEGAMYEQAVASELGRAGYQISTGGPAAQVAEVRIERQQRAPGERRGPVSVGVGGSTGSYGSGLGVGIGLDLTPPPKPVIDSTLAVTIRDNGTGQVLWEGRALFAASTDSPYAEQKAAATRLAAALFGGFPGASGQTITVK